jgi:hypothetical protein
MAVFLTALLLAAAAVGMLYQQSKGLHVLRPCGVMTMRSVLETKGKRVVVVCANRQVKIVE